MQSSESLGDLPVGFVLDAALSDDNMMTTPLTFVKRATLPKDLIQEILTTSKKFSRPGIPVRQLRTHNPNPAIYHDFPSNMRLKLGECIGYGRSGIAFKVEPEGLALNSPNATLPPLVAKIGRQHYNKWLLREAWFYEEMQTVQGVAIPWCYGLYSARIPVVPGRAFLPWIEGWRESVFVGRSDIEFDKLVKSYEESDGKYGHDEKNLESEPGYLEGFGNFRDQYSDLVKEFEDESNSDQRSTVVTVLILEELGEPYLPEGGKNWPMKEHIPEHITKDIYDAYDRLSELGISHMDIKHENILKAPAQINPSVPENDIARRDAAGQVSDNISTNLKCRIIDFELSKKMNYTRERINKIADSHLETLIDSARVGSPIGQNDFA